MKFRHMLLILAACIAGYLCSGCGQPQGGGNPGDGGIEPTTGTETTYNPK